MENPEEKIKKLVELRKIQPLTDVPDPVFEVTNKEEDRELEELVRKEREKQIEEQGYTNEQWEQHQKEQEEKAIEEEEERWEEEKKKFEEEWEKREREKIRKEEKLEELIEKKVTDEERKKIEEEASKIKKLYALDYWMRCFNEVSYCNDLAGQALFHVCLGQALNDFRIEQDDGTKLDWRINFIWIQNSGSGKGKALNFLNRVMTHSNFLKRAEINGMPMERKFSTTKLGRMNPAALLNTYLINKYGQIIKNDDGAEKLKLGLLEKSDLIYSEEAREVLESGQRGFELQEIIMTSMETIGSSNNVYTKTLTNYEEPCRTVSSASFAFSTRPIEKIKKTVVESGFIQRMLFYPRLLTGEEREEMNRRSAFSSKRKNEKTDFPENFESLISELNKVVNFAQPTYIDFREDSMDELRAFLLEKMMYFVNDIETTIPSSENREILHSLASRYKNHMLIIAFHSAAMRFSKVVEKQDLQYAFDFVKKLYEAQKLWVTIAVHEDREVTQEERFMDEEIRRYYTAKVKNHLVDENGFVDFSGLIHHIAKTFRRAYLAARYHVVKFAKGSDPLLEIVDNPNNTRLKLVRLAKTKSVTE